MTIWQKRAISGLPTRRSIVLAIIAALLTMPVTLVQAQAPVRVIGWDETAVQFRTDPNSNFDLFCPPIADPSPFPVWGTDTYTDNSSICAAAVHAGVITLEGGRLLLLRIDGLDGRGAYIASTRNGIVTMAEDDWFWSFIFGEAPPL